MVNQEPTNTWKFISVLFTFMILILSIFLAVDKNLEHTYNIEGMEISKVDLNSLQEVAFKDNMGKFVLCSTSNSKCVLVGKL